MEVIPLGEECYIAQSIDGKFKNCDFRINAYPFDYVGHVFIDSIIKKISTDLSIKKEDIEIMKSNDIYFLSDKIVDFRYWHHFTQNNNNFIQIDEFLKIINNRYIRFKNILYSEKKILFITGQHFDYIYKKINRFDKLMELYNILKNINKNIILLAFNYSDKEFKKDDLYHYIVDVSYNIDFKTSKDLFINKFNEYIKKILLSF